MKLIFFTILIITGLVSYSCKDDSNKLELQQEIKQELKQQQVNKTLNIKKN